MGAITADPVCVSVGVYVCVPARACCLLLLCWSISGCGRNLHLLLNVRGEMIHLRGQPAYGIFLFLQKNCGMTFVWVFLYLLSAERVIFIG